MGSYMDGFESSAGSGRINLALDDNFSPMPLLGEVGHIMNSSRPLHQVASDHWIEEGFAEFSGEYKREILSKNSPSWWDSKWNLTLQEGYAVELFSMKYVGAWGTPISVFKPFDSAVGQMGTLFVEDLYKTMGHDAYVNMTTGIYNWQSNNLDTRLGPNVFQQYALSSAPNDSVKAEVQKLFDERVWGK
jgi:hypothetical protein